MSGEAFRAPWLVTAASVFASASTPLYAVGGLVRNDLMALPASDIDVCGPARPERVLALCEGSPVRATARAAHFGTVELHVADASGRHLAEYTTFRMDSYRGGHQPIAVRFADSPEVDALRRDFSVNALYRPLHADPDAPAELIDPTGGLAHLRRGLLHTVTDDPDQVLKDDGLRILRAARFQAELGLTPTPALLASAARFSALLEDIACERLRDELSKLLLSDLRYPTLKRTEPPVTAGLRTVLAVGAWPRLFVDVPPDDAAVAATAFYRAPEGMPPVAGKLALLFAHAEADRLAAAMTRLRYSARDTAAAAAALIAMRGIAENRLPLMDAMRLGVTAVAHAQAAFAALRQAGEPCGDALESAQTLLERMNDHDVPANLRALAVHGEDLLPIRQRLGASAASTGRTLNALWEAAVEKRVPNERQALLAMAERLLAGETEKR